MPHVASEPKAFAPKHPLPQARAPQAPDRASASPFESLLDSAPARDNSPPPAADDAPRADRPEAAKPAQQADQAGKPAKPADKPKSDSKAGDTANVSDAKPADGDAKTNQKADTDSDTKTTKDAKEAAKAATDGDANQLAGLIPGTDPAKPAADAKPADAVAVAIMDTVVVPKTPVAAPAPADALAVGLVAGADAQANAKPAAAGETTIVAAAAANLEKTATAKSDAAKTGDESKPTADDAAKSADKSADAAGSKPHIEAKPQVGTGEDEKNSSAHARGENSAKDDRLAATHAGAAPNAEPNAAAPKAGNEPFQPLLTTPQQHAAQPPTNLAAPQVAAHTAAVPLAGVAIEITNKALSGTDHFEIRLDPPELGRIEVRMDVDRDGNVTSRLIADRADTLDLLRRDASGLERALQDAGLKTGDNAMQFSLRDQSGNQQQAEDGSSLTRINVTDDMVSVADSTQRIYSRLAGQGSGIDIHV